MKQTRTPILIIVLALMCFLGACLSGSTYSVQAATSADLTLVGDIGLPENVVQVMLDNSLDANGKTPTVAADAVTVQDIQSWQTVSLANRKSESGVTQSTTNSTVAAWIGSLQTATTDSVETSDMLLWQDIAENLNGKYAAATVLSSGIMDTGYGRKHTYTAQAVPIYNKLMAVLMSATNAKTIDLTGLVSQVADASTRVKMLSMFRTIDMTQLTELDLGYNLFGPGLVGGWGYDCFRGNTLHSSSVLTWNLSFEGLTALDSVLLQNIGTQTQNVNLASNSLTDINWNNSQFLGHIGADGSINMDGNVAIDPEDQNTVFVVMKLLGNGGDTVLPDNVANAMIAAAIALKMPSMITVTALNAVADQLSAATLTTLANYASEVSSNSWSGVPDVMKAAALDVSSWPTAAIQEMSDEAFATLLKVVSADAAVILKNKRNGTDTGGGDSTAASIVVNGDWQFNYQLGQTATTLTTSDVVTLSGTVPKGQTLTVAMSPWQAGNQTIAPTLTFGYGGNMITVPADNTAVAVLVNTSGADTILANTLENGTLALQAQDINSFTEATAYHGTLNWSIENVPTSAYLR